MKVASGEYLRDQVESLEKMAYTLGNLQTVDSETSETKELIVKTIRSIVLGIRRNLGLDDMRKRAQLIEGVINLLESYVCPDPDELLKKLVNDREGFIEETHRASGVEKMYVNELRELLKEFQ